MLLLGSRLRKRTQPSRSLRTWSAGAWLFAACWLAGPASAHLSIIRQGAETGDSNEPGDQHGYSVVAGDFNGDGFDDLVMGAPQEDVGTIANAGTITVNWGSNYGITHLGSTAYTAANMTGTVMAGANLGWSLAAADLNQDGFDDLLVGAPFETINGFANAGRVYIMKGSSSGLLAWMQLNQANFSTSPETGDKFGFAIAVGHFNSGIDPDVVIGSPGEDTSTGVAHYVLGTSTGPFGAKGALNLANSGQSLRTGDQFGFSLSTGNLMGSAEDEIVCGVPYRSSDTGAQNFGAIMVTPGAAEGPQASSSLFYLAPGSIESNANFGFSLAAGRLMSGAYEALAIGEPLRSIHPVPQAGRVVVFPGGTSGLATGSFVEVLDTNAGGTLGSGDAFGQKIAVGYFWDSADGWEDLAVGTPAEGAGTISYGQVQILNGGPNGPTGVYGWSGFNQGTLNETVEIIDVLGSSLAFGQFDGTGFGNLAVGAPGEDSFAGMVHVIAPWRQVYGLSCERSIVLDCDDEIYFSQKPFDQVSIASTTKIMTVLLACEHVITHGDVDLDDLYTVPAWVADNIPGSQVPLFEDEEITFEDLMYTCLMRSGNDAAFAIADMVHGSHGPFDSLPIFVNEMNAKASLIGMTNTHFHNPAGLDNEPVGPEMGEHYSTPLDMAILSSYAMGNALFAEIAGTLVWELVRHFPEFDIAWDCNNIFAGILMNNIAPLTGIKGGYTSNAKTTGCFSGESPTGNHTITGTYTTPDPPTNYGPDAGALVQLGLSACGYYFTLPEEWDYGSPFAAHRPRSGNGDRYGASAAMPRPWSGNMEFSVFRTSWGTGASALTMELIHQAQLRGDNFYDVGAYQISGHGPISIRNVGQQSSAIRVTLPTGSQFFNLNPGEAAILPALQQSWENFPIRLASTEEQNIDLDVEIPYLHDVTSPADPISSPVYQTTLFRGANITDDGFEVRTLGLDAEASSYSILGHAPGQVVAVPGDEETESDASSAPLVRLRAPQPNPSRALTQIGFDLATPGEVGIDIYDMSGRLVRSYPRTQMSAGGWGVQWDGRSENGTTAVTGVFAYRVTFNGEVAATGKLTRVR